jgi:hypothetical protein
MKSEGVLESERERENGQQPAVFTITKARKNEREGEREGGRETNSAVNKDQKCTWSRAKRSKRVPF